MNKNHSPYIYIYISLAFMLLIASCDKPQSENKASSSSSVDAGNGGAKPEAKPEHSFSFLQASHRIERTANSYTKAVTEAHKPTDDDRTIAYSSSNDKIATVDDKGLVTFNTEGGGTVTIKAEKKKKGKHVLRSAQYTLYITVKPTDKAALVIEIKKATKAHGNKVDLNYIDTSAITNMESMFTATAFNGDISKWDVSQVTDMIGMFNDATAFNGDISAWNVSQVITMQGMFAGATVFNQDISAWKVSQVTDMSYMFNRATAFNQDISAWKVSQVTDMRGMFQGATAFTQDLGSWGQKLHGTIKANNMRNANNMFQRSGVTALPSWCTGDCDHTSTR